MKNKLVKYLSGLFIFMMLLFLIIENLSKPRVFILHSYSQEYSWVNDINEGIERIFKNKPYSLKWHYMDTKRHPSQEYIKLAGATAVKMIKNFNPSIIIAIDDNAQKFVSNKFLNKKNISIVFAGMNAAPKAYKYDKGNNVTGILERIPFDDFVDVFTRLLKKNKRRIIHISDNSITSKLIHEELKTVKWKPLKLVKSYQCKTFKEWKSAVTKSNKQGDALLITHYHTILGENGEVVKPNKVVQWTEKNSIIPNIGCWGFFVEDGGMMAVAVSPYEQGEKAAKIASNIIDNNKKAKDIKIITNEDYVVYIRQKSIKKRKIEIPKILRAFAKATNHYY